MEGSRAAAGFQLAEYGSPERRMTVYSTNPVFVVFEGLDGSGKSTCAKQTAELLGAEYWTTPPAELRAHRQTIIESYGRCQEAVQLFYLSTVFAASDRAKHLLANGKSIVLDRYFLSTQVYAEFRGSSLSLDSIGDRLLPAGITIFLDVPLEVRRKRLKKRGPLNEDLETLSTHADSRLRQLYAQRAEHPVVGKWLNIDASTDRPNTIARQVASCVSQGFHINVKDLM